MSSTTYTNLAVRAPVEETVGVLEAAGVAGLVGPQAGEWCGVFVEGDGFGLVGRTGRDVATVARRVSDRATTAVVAVTVFEGRVLGYDLFQDGRPAGYYVSRPGEWTREDLSEEGGDPLALARLCGHELPPDDLAATLRRDAYGDEVERHRRLTALLGLPAYLVGTAAGDVRGGDGPDTYTEIELVGGPRRRRDTGRALRVVALGLACFAVYVWVRAVREGSWGEVVFAVVATAVAALAGWLSTERGPLRRAWDAAGERPAGERGDR